MRRRDGVEDKAEEEEKEDQGPFWGRGEGAGGRHGVLLFALFGLRLVQEEE